MVTGIIIVRIGISDKGVRGADGDTESMSEPRYIYVSRVDAHLLEEVRPATMAVLMLVVAIVHHRRPCIERAGHVEY